MKLMLLRYEDVENFFIKLFGEAKENKFTIVLEHVETAKQILLN